MRLRQAVFVARDLEAGTRELCEILGIEVAYRDPGVGKWGLANVVCPVGDSSGGFSYLERLQLTSEEPAAF